MIVADLHVHTTASDGTMEFPEVRAAARAAGLDSVAITDHDCLHPALDAPITRLGSERGLRGDPESDGDAESEPDFGDGEQVGTDSGGSGEEGLTVIRGIELRVDAGFESIDLLGYGVRRTPQLARELDRLGRDRAERGRHIVERVEKRLGVDLDIAIDGNVGRPHVARAIADSEANYDYRGAFEHLIGEGCPCYVARDLPAIETGVELLTGACGVVSLAHPFRYREPERALERCEELGIDAVERYYPYGRAVDEALLDRAIEEYDLLVTGGSDAHDQELGRAGPSATQYEPFAERLSRS
ncbi:PHP domain-containing protein [Halobacteriales archaeon QS_3_64_16]|nr:MAG: PHP domain-containing protein [Halobacteriales archaeon QS_3_64_16]